MSQLAKSVYEEQQQSTDESIRGRPVITRFCGTSGGSCTALKLVQSIVVQIRYCLDLPYVPTPAGQVFEDAKGELHKLLHENPVVLFIDSLDQLSDEDEARKKISFLAGLDPHVNTRVVVSTLPDEPDPKKAGRWIRFFGCDTRLNLVGTRQLPTMK